MTFYKLGDLTFETDFRIFRRYQRNMGRRHRKDDYMGVPLIPKHY